MVAMYGNELNVHRVHLGAIKVVPRRSHQLVSHNLFFSSPCFNKINYQIQKKAKYTTRYGEIPEMISLILFQSYYCLHLTELR